MTRHRERVGRAAALEADIDGDIVAAPGFVGDRRQRGQQAAKIDRGHVLPLQFGIEPAGVGNVRDQPVEPLDVVLDHRQQPRAAVLVARQRQRFDRGAQRGQRILQFMGDVGGEHLDRLDAVIERVRHVAQRAGKMADLVAAAGEIGNFDAGPDAAADPLGAVGEPAHRACDGAGQQQRQARSSPRQRRRRPSGSPAARRSPSGRCRRPGSTASARRCTARNRCTGTATETITSPRSLIRTMLLFWPFSARHDFL